MSQHYVFLIEKDGYEILTNDKICTMCHDGIWDKIRTVCPKGTSNKEYERQMQLQLCWYDLYYMREYYLKKDDKFWRCKMFAKHCKYFLEQMMEGLSIKGKKGWYALHTMPTKKNLDLIIKELSLHEEPK